MIQKSHSQPPGKWNTRRKQWDVKLPTSQLVNAGFLNHQQYMTHGIVLFGPVFSMIVTNDRTTMTGPWDERFIYLQFLVDFLGTCR